MNFESSPLAPVPQHAAVTMARYEAARYALQAAVAVDEVKDIHDKALAMAAYAKQAQDPELLEWATEIKVRAERRAGEMLAAMDLQHGARGVRKSGVPKGYPATNLVDLGVTKKQSARWQKLAAVPAEQFEQAVAAAKEVAGEVRTSLILRRMEPENTTRSTPVDRKSERDDGAPAPLDGAEELDHLRAQLSEAQEIIADQAAQIEALEAAERGDAAETILALKRELQTMRVSRDGYMRERTELVREIKSLRRKYGLKV